MVRPGDFVDVIASFDKEEIDSGANKVVYPRITKTVLQNVQILSLGQDQVVAEDKSKELPKTVTLAVSPQDAEKLVYVSEYAVLRLALRPIDDKNVADTPGTIRGDFVTNKGVQILPMAPK
jgi:pilus assembly protein CpaB